MQQKIAGRDLPLLIYFLLAVPTEFLFSFPLTSGIYHKNWLLLLNLGPFVEVAGILGALFLLRKNLIGVSTDTPESDLRARLILVGIGVGLLIAAVWWQIFLYLTKLSCAQDYILGKMPFEYGYYPGEQKGGVGFGIAFCIFIAIYLGTVAGDLVSRWSQRERAFVWLLRPERNLTWDLWITWIVFYRLSVMVVEMFWIPISHSKIGNTSAEGMIILAFSYVGPALTCVPAAIWLTRHRPATRSSSIRSSFVASLLVSLGGGILFLPLNLAGLPTIALCLFTLNFPGWAWTWVAGEMRWRAFQPGAISSV